MGRHIRKTPFYIAPVDRPVLIGPRRKAKMKAEPKCSKA